ncbi:hypothetical protein CP533_5036 [Ophiocordyceps camponoti-saundersi (nom. inval.)]|nr:hypothetical protein CP533_5036 [Ophiocordyceps camponoti-saundersi (nom. inval.)]
MMILSTQLTAITALLASTVSAFLGCHASFESGTEYYSSPTGCCSPEFATVLRDSVGNITNIHCGHIHVKGNTDWLQEIPLCDELAKWAPTCPHIRYVLEGVPQQDECTKGLITPNPDPDPNDKRGCYNGRVYANDGKCCSIDYVVTDEDGTRCGKRAFNLGADNKIPRPLTNVPRCSKPIEPSQCPFGVFASIDALVRVQKCLTCCPAGYTRDYRLDCRRHDMNVMTLARYWRARRKDGCELPQAGPSCCHDRRHFRNSKGECSDRNGRQKPTPTELYVRRIERDGCTDYLDHLGPLDDGYFDLDLET